ncbi:apolipoprotein L2-like [Arvicola amphibius]|uniref:apolipoprotein L2-like n=1 Tax=Arvicola amphibius TaxID=1047088 RepID=UPI0018E2CA37|nr:apolipoprotein L2-like [Arvicola amphibius]XP_038198098.1 apolipoprotein L2-like [Arvicola amphibius]XP_038198099.1 apolipoprotein L2-like [Arvicola amphibius]
MGSTERNEFIESMVGYLLDTTDTEVLQFMLNEEEAWKQFVEEAGLSREEELFLREALAEIIPDPDVEDEVDKTERDEEDDSRDAHGETTEDSDVDDEDDLQNALQEKERFLKVYPQVKRELEESIRKLHALADKIDKVHRDCTITQVVASSTGAVSGVMTVLGLALAPVTAGVSLGLSATGLGLGAAATVTSVSATIVEKVSTASVEAEASQLLPRSNDTEKDIKSNNTEKVIKEVLEKNTPRLISASKNSFRNLEVMKKNIDAIKLTKANPRLANSAKRLMTTGKVSARRTRQVKKAFGGTALAMTKRARIMGAATAGLALVLDIVSLIDDSKHLQEGAKAESAEKLRQQAQDLEQKLQELSWVHDSLNQ